MTYPNYWKTYPNYLFSSEKASDIHFEWMSEAIFNI